MEEIIILSLFSIWITGFFTPFNQPREWITDKWIRLCIRLNVPTLSNAIVLLSCPKCFGFWFSWIYTQSFVVGLSVAFMSFFINFAIQEMNKQSLK